MDSKITISCIMPVYNSEKYIRETLDSMLNQSFTHFELICVDDCSIDQSFDILKEYQTKDKRIKIISNEKNMGAGESRNIGFKKATGKYIIFVDSDDIFDSDMFEKAYRCACDTDADVVCWGYRIERCAINGITEKTITYNRVKASTLTNKNISLKDIKEMSYAVFTKLIKKQLIDEFNIRFQDLPNSNDVFFVSQVLFRAKKVVMLNQCLMTYKYNLDENLSSKRSRKENYILYAHKEVMRYLEENHLNLSFATEEYIEYALDAIMTEMSYPKYSMSDYSKQFILDTLHQDEEIQKLLRKYKNSDKFAPHIKVMIEDALNLKCDISKNLYTYCSDEIKQLRKDYSCIAIWGCGKIGKSFLDEMDRQNIRIDYVIDQDTQKKGLFYNNHMIFCYEDVKDQVQVIMIASEQYRDEVEKQAVGKKVFGVHDF